MSFNFITYEKEDPIAFITLNRPEKRNALNAEMIGELKAAFADASGNDQVRVIILKASGKAFSAGADLDYLLKLRQNSPEENLADSHELKALFVQIYTCPKLVIAQVEGPAVAGGCGLVSVCDIVFSSPEARFGYTESKIGFVPALVTFFLIRRTGEGRARELLLSGNLIPAEEAADYGLVNFIVGARALPETVLNYAWKCARETAPASIAFIKELLAGMPGMSLSQAMDRAADLNARSRLNADFRKGLKAFLAGDKPLWSTGRR